MFGLVSLASNALAFATKALGLLRDLGLYFAGKKAQQADDLKAANQEARDAQAIDDRIETMSDADLAERERLRQSGTHPR